MNFSSISTDDVSTVRTGLSGIGAAYYLQAMRPDQAFAILEADADIGGTWDLFRYPEIRSDRVLRTSATSSRVGEPGDRQCGRHHVLPVGDGRRTCMD